LFQIKNYSDGVAATAAAERRALQESIVQGISRLRNQTWNANLPFHVYLCLKSENLPCTPTSFVKNNLFELTSAIHGLGQGTIARFDPSLYHVRSPKMSDNIETWDKLCSDPPKLGEGQTA
jgi:hypothetical protein